MVDQRLDPVIVQVQAVDHFHQIFAQTLVRRLHYAGDDDIPPTSPLFEDDEHDDDDQDDQQQRVSDEELLAMAGPWDDRVPRFNTIHLTGRVGNDPEPRYFDDGKVVVNLSLAVKRKYHFLARKALGAAIAEQQDDTDWYALDIWGQTAEFVSKFVDKGARVGVVGSLKIDKWLDKETREPRSRAKVVVREFDILETRAEAEARRSRRGMSSPYNREQQQQQDDFGGSGGPSPAGTGGFFD